MALQSDAARALEHIDKHLRFEVYDAPSMRIVGSCIPKDGLKRYMTLDRLRTLLAACHIEIHPETVRNHYLAVFTNLLYIKKGPYIKYFTHERRFYDTFLPFDEHQRWPDDCDFFESFNEKQLEFCAVELNSDNLEEVNFDETARIPITEITSLKDGHGTDSSTHRIQIHPDYDSLPKDTKDPTSPRYLILKSCQFDKRESHRNEVRGYNVLREFPDISNNIARYFGSWTKGDSCYILLEYINGGTLTNMLHEYPPTSPEDMLRLWQRLLLILDPLCKIHSHPHPNNGSTVAIGAHQDIKPDNILVSRASSGLKYDFIFKLADLGLAYFEAGDKDERVLGRESPGTQMYSAPECFRNEKDLVDYQSTRSVDPRADVWSTGCVLSEAVVWAVLGPNTWKEYHELRVAETDKIPDLEHTAYSGCFHDGHSVLSVVHDMHHRVRAGRRMADQIVNDILPIIDDMLRNVDSRPDATTVRRRFRYALDTAKRMSGIPPSEVEYPEPFRNYPDQSPEQFSREMAPRSRASRHPPPRPSPSPSRGIPTASYVRHTPPVLPPSRAMTFDPSTGLSSTGGPSSFHQSKPLPRATTDLGSTTSNLERLNLTPIAQEGPKEPLRVRFPERDPGAIVQPKDRGPDTIERGGLETLLENRRQSTNVSLHSTEQPLRGVPEAAVPPQPEITTQDLTNRSEVPYATIPEVLAWIEKRKKNKGRSPTLLPGDVPESSLNSLHGRDQIFLIDSSASMLRHRKDVIETFKALAYLVKRFDPDGIDIYFTNHPDEGHGKDREKLVALIEKIRFSGACSMDVTLPKILSQRSEHWISSILRRASNKKKFGISVYVFTDGIWNNPDDSSAGSIPRFIKRTVEKMNGRAELGIQFIQFGNNSVGTDRLAMLDDSLVKEYGVEEDIIDVTHHSSNVYKMLHGAIDDGWDKRSSTEKCSSSSR